MQNNTSKQPFTYQSTERRIMQPSGKPVAAFQPKKKSENITIEDISSEFYEFCLH